MNGTLSIDAFHAQLTSSATDHPLLNAVRHLMGLNKRELLAVVDTLGGWTGWYW